ncbi:MULTISPECIES: Arc family DNA-binding protein [Acinetobacter]|uniref:Arc family DNA-binding protein n=1 Tax=Acinetobacter piscicola TaxID=2006115 RepID=A0A7S6VVG5_9GAMM|nr:MULTISPECIES: Arc family DNA-binding protein [Acinetobacter]QOW45553.1 Arc family DNA-binding protein [Acinetobacter piscicola]
MARNDPQMNLRVPVELKEQIEKAAFESNRTITAEAVSRLQYSFRTLPSLHLEAALHHVPTEELISELMRRYDDAELVMNFSRKKFNE